jgi:hypothetical protein
VFAHQPNLTRVCFKFFFFQKRKQLFLEQNFTFWQRRKGIANHAMGFFYLRKKGPKWPHYEKKKIKGNCQI